MTGLANVFRYGGQALCAVAACVVVAACDSSGEPDSVAPPAPPTSPAPPTGPVTVSDVVTTSEASRFLSQATFGPSSVDVGRLETVGLSAWLQAEFSKPQESFLQQILLAEASGVDVGSDELSEAFWTRAILSDDQLRQRVGYALSQLFVVSYEDVQIERRPVLMANYMDIMSAGAFGNFRQTLENVTYSPAMAIYLTYLQNQKADEERQVVPDENYAREVMQLFTIGLLELQPNGEPRLDGAGQPIETYDNTDVTELAKVFTGLSWGGRDRFFGNPDTLESEYLPLEMYDDQHSPESKTFLGTTIPANTDGVTSIDIALDTLFDHPNTAPFVSRQLIQRLVTSNPSPAYVLRVATAFEEGSFAMPNGQVAGGGQRGDMRAVIAAILLDPEARDPAMMSDPFFGKIREPVLRLTHWARAFGVSEIDVDAARVFRDTTGPDRLGQQAYRSPSVFNFYRPGFVSPGSESADQGLVAPELQITTASSVTGYANFMERVVTGNASDTAFLPDYADELSLANDPAALVDHLDEILTYGSLDAATRERVTQAVSSITSDNGGFTRDERRVQTAVWFMMTSSDYIIAR